MFKKLFKKKPKTYDEIMQTIASGLTGQPEKDMKYLKEQGEIYKTHESAQEILKGIGRLMYGALPQEKREEFDQAFDNDMRANANRTAVAFEEAKFQIRKESSHKVIDLDINNNRLNIAAAIKEAEFQIHKKDFRKALKILESIIKEIESQLVYSLFLFDTIEKYYHFHNPFEELLYYNLYELSPGECINYMTEDYGRLYSLYGAMLFEFKRFDEAKKALTKAIKINPINDEPLFELAEISKIRGEWDEYSDITRQSFKIAYTRESIARYYRNMGFYFIEKQDYDLAIALYFVSKFYVKHPMVEHELLYIQKKAGRPIPMLSQDQIKEMFKKNDIPFGPDQTVMDLAFWYGTQAEKDKKYNAAWFFYSILYGITYDEEIWKRMDNLPTGRK